VCQLLEGSSLHLLTLPTSRCSTAKFAGYWSPAWPNRNRLPGIHRLRTDHRIDTGGSHIDQAKEVLPKDVKRLVFFPDAPNGENRRSCRTVGDSQPNNQLLPHVHVVVTVVVNIPIVLARA
jgi:hypothetical protein